MAGLAIFALYRYVGRQSRQLGAIMAAGLLLRLTIGLLLFTISYLDLPQLRAVHSSDGFWAVAPDARLYTRRASAAAVEGLDIISDGSASPLYVKTLALWMRGTGAGPASGFFLNVFLYSLLCAVFVYAWKPRGDWRHDLPCILALASFSFAPGALFHGTQALKDDLVFLLMVTLSVGALLVLKPADHAGRPARAPWSTAGGLALLAVALYVVAGIRAYYAILTWVSLVIALTLFVYRETAGRRLNQATISLTVALLTAWSIALGAGSYGVFVTRLGRAAVTAADGAQWYAPEALPERLEAVLAEAGRAIGSAREGFERTGGGTNLAEVAASADRGDADRPDADQLGANGLSVEVIVLEGEAVEAAAVADAETRSGLRLHGRRLVLGLAALFVPISILTSLSFVEVAGGRGLLFLTDVDTLFMDVAIVASFVLLYRRWTTARQHLPYLCFVLLLGGITAVLMAYVVTNFGTLFRLRIMAVVPLWLVVLATADDRLTGPAADPGASLRVPGRSID